MENKALHPDSIATKCGNVPIQTKEPFREADVRIRMMDVQTGEKSFKSFVEWLNKEAKAFTSVGKTVKL